MVPRALLMVLLAVFTGCAGAAPGVLNAGVNTAIAATASGVRRANGECFVPCNPGTTCNKSTGMCDPIPCAGRCGFDEKCESTYLGDKCVSLKAIPNP